MSDVMAIGDWRTNGALIADAARLGYVEGLVLDLTYGEGKFWTDFRPEHLVTNDLDPAKGDHHFDVTLGLPNADATFDTVVFDPPYKLAGKRWGDDMDRRFGTSEYSSLAAIETLLSTGIREGARLTRRWLLVKCMDQVNAGQVRWQTDIATSVALYSNLTKVDTMMLRRWRPQPAGRSQKHARRNYSTLLVFEKRS